MFFNRGSRKIGGRRYGGKRRTGGMKHKRKWVELKNVQEV